MEREDKLIGFAGGTCGNLVGCGSYIECIPGVESVRDIGVDLYSNATPQAVGAEDAPYIYA